MPESQTGIATPTQRSPAPQPAHLGLANISRPGSQSREIATHPISSRKTSYPAADSKALLGVALNVRHSGWKQRSVYCLCSRLRACTVPPNTHAHAAIFGSGLAPRYGTLRSWPSWRSWCPFGRTAVRVCGGDCKQMSQDFGCNRIADERLTARRKIVHQANDETIPHLLDRRALQRRKSWELRKGQPNLDLLHLHRQCMQARKPFGDHHQWRWVSAYRVI